MKTFEEAMIQVRTSDPGLFRENVYALIQEHCTCDQYKGLIIALMEEHADFVIQAVQAGDLNKIAQATPGILAIGFATGVLVGMAMEKLD